MRIGIYGGDTAAAERATVDVAVAAAAAAEEQGFPSYWLPQIFGLDALTTLAAIGREVPGIELGTAVVPTYPRHPMVLAGQALTVQSATGNRLTLGIGLSHQLVVESMWGYTFEKPLRHMREYLSVLLPLINGEQVAFKGETIQGFSMGPLGIADVSAPPVLLAALGPKMLELAATEAGGTITWMTGPATLADHTVPTLNKAAQAAGRASPRVVAGLPICVTSDEAGARGRAAGVFAVYGQLPSYRAMLDREGAAGPADVAIVGDEAAVRSQLDRLAEAGATDFVAAELGATDEERSRTRDVLRSLL